MRRNKWFSVQKALWEMITEVRGELQAEVGLQRLLSLFCKTFLNSRMNKWTEEAKEHVAFFFNHIWGWEKSSLYSEMRLSGPYNHLSLLLSPNTLMAPQLSAPLSGFYDTFICGCPVNHICIITVCKCYHSGLFKIYFTFMRSRNYSCK